MDGAESVHDSVHDQNVVSTFITTTGRKRKPSTLYNDKNYFAGSDRELNNEVIKSEKQYKKEKKMKIIKQKLKQKEKVLLKNNEIEEQMILQKLQKVELQRKRKECKDFTAGIKVSIDFLSQPPPLTNSSSSSSSGISTTAYDLRQSLQYDIEHKHIKKYKSLNKKQIKKFNELSTEQFEHENLDEAIKQSCKQCTSLVLDWNSSAAQMIGHLCKIWWDGEQTWFYARLLNYDTRYNKYYIFYLLDNTAEWISIDNEIIMIGIDIVYASKKPTSRGWPAQKFWLSEKAHQLLQDTNSHYRKTGVYVEFLNCDHEYDFVSEKCLKPFIRGNVPKDRIKSLKDYLNNIDVELSLMNRVIEGIKRESEELIASYFGGNDIIGWRVRAASHRLIMPGERFTQSTLDSSSAFSIGTIAAYSEALNKHFIVFDEEMLQPQWKVCQRPDVEVILDNEVGRNNQINKRSESTLSVENLPPASMRIKLVSQLTSSASQSENYSHDDTSSSFHLHKMMTCSLCGSGKGFLAEDTFKNSTNDEDGITEEISTDNQISNGQVQRNTLRSRGKGKRKSHVTVENDHDEDIGCKFGFRTCHVCQRHWHNNCMPDKFFPAVPDQDLIESKQRNPYYRSLFSMEEKSKSINDPEYVDEISKYSHTYTAKSDYTKFLKQQTIGNEISSSDEDLNHVTDDNNVLQNEYKVMLAYSKDSKWICWHCLKCSKCGVSAWEQPLLPWNTKLIQEDCADVSMLLCGKCLYKFRVTRNYCPVCFDFYAETDSHGRPIHSTVTSPAINKTNQLSAKEELSNIHTKDISDDNSNVINLKETGDFDCSNAPSVEADNTASEVLEDAADLTADVETNGSVSAVKPCNSDVKDDEKMVMCHECHRWVHSVCEGIDDTQYIAMTIGKHPIWGDEYLCPPCRVALSKKIITFLQQYDTLNMFAVPVSEQIAAGYYDTIRNPMDMQTMAGKANMGQYKSLQALRQDFELMCLNALIFNTDGDEYWKAAKLFQEEVQTLFTHRLHRKSHESLYYIEAMQLVEDYRLREVASKAEKRRSSSIQNQSELFGPQKRKRAEFKPKLDDELENGQSRGEGKSLSLASKPQPSDDSADDANAAVNGKLGIDSLDVILPTKLTSPPYGKNDDSVIDPRTCVVVRSVEESFYTVWQDECAICTSADSSEWFIFCVDCGEAFHSFCVGVYISRMPQVLRDTWRCNGCDQCSICHLAFNNSALSNSIVKCSVCQKRTHSSCLANYFSHSGSEWYCADCVNCGTCQDMGSSLRGNDSRGDHQLENNADRRRKKWGFSEKQCYRCQFIIDQRGKLSLSLMGLLCNICYKEISNSNYGEVVICTRCHMSSHTSCGRPLTIKNMESVTYGPNQYDFLCMQCLRQPNTFMISHLGTDYRARMLAVNISSIQQLRDSARNLGYCDVFEKCFFPWQMSTICTSARRWFLLSIINWASIRMQWLTTTCLQSYGGLKNFFFSQTLRTVRGEKMKRARAFARLWYFPQNITDMKDFINGNDNDVHTFTTAAAVLDNKKEWLQNMRKSLYLGIKICLSGNGDDWVDLPHGKIVEIAELAASLIEVTDIELNLYQQVDVELIEVATQLKKNFEAVFRGGKMTFNTKIDSISNQEKYQQLYEGYLKLLKLPMSSSHLEIEKNDLILKGANENFGTWRFSVKYTMMKILQRIDANAVCLKAGTSSKSMKSKELKNEVTPNEDTDNIATSAKVSSSGSYDSKSNVKYRQNASIDKFVPNINDIGNDKVKSIAACNSETTLLCPQAAPVFTRRVGKDAFSEYRSVDLLSGDHPLANVANHQYLTSEMKEQYEKERASYEGAFTSLYEGMNSAMEGAIKKFVGETDHLIEIELQRQKEQMEWELKEVEIVMDILVTMIEVCNLPHPDPDQIISNHKDTHHAAADALESVEYLGVEPKIVEQSISLSTTDSDCNTKIDMAPYSLIGIDGIDTANSQQMKRENDALDRNIPSIETKEHLSLQSGVIISDSKVGEIVLAESNFVTQNGNTSFVKMDPESKEGCEEIKKDDDTFGLNLPSIESLLSDCPSGGNQYFSREDRQTQLFPSATKYEALCGRVEGICTNQSEEWQDPRCCVLCSDGKDACGIAGRFVSTLDGSYFHINCLRWSFGVVERNGMLYNTKKLGEDAKKFHCCLCHQKGATLQCMGNTRKRLCRNRFHLRCAIAAHCLLAESIQTDRKGNIIDEDTIYTLCLCPAHVNNIPATNSLRTKNHWIPHDPRRYLVIADDSQTIVDSCELALQSLSARRVDKVVRAGALTIHNLGQPIADLVGFFTSDFIYPHHFRSSRVYWSMTQPRKRTLYFFEVFKYSDFENVDEEVLSYIREMLEYYSDRSKKDEAEDKVIAESPKSTEATSLHGIGQDFAVMRVIAMDNLDCPIFTRTAEQAYTAIIERVQHCQAGEMNIHPHLKHTTFIQEKNSSKTNESNSDGQATMRIAHIFFGFGLEFVRHAIELLPDSIGTMVKFGEYTNNSGLFERYHPSHLLPTRKNALLYYQKQLNVRNEGLPASINGSARADGYAAVERRFTGRKITRILSKVATQDSVVKKSNEKGDEDEEDPTDPNRNEELDLLITSQRYSELAELYKKNPFAKLDVMKSAIHGWGLFAKVNLEKDDYIVEYIGQKIRTVIADRREQLYEEEGVGSCYLFRLDKDEIIDATRRGGIARFINHCCEPNAYAKVIKINIKTLKTYNENDYHLISDGIGDYEPLSRNEELVCIEKHIIIMAAKDIQEGEEITYDYQFPIEDEKLKCYCGASSCGGYLN